MEKIFSEPRSQRPALYQFLRLGESSALPPGLNSHTESSNTDKKQRATDAEEQNCQDRKIDINVSDTQGDSAFFLRLPAQFRHTIVDVTCMRCAGAQRSGVCH